MHGPEGRREGGMQRSLTRLVEAQWGEGEMHDMPHHTMTHYTIPYHTIPCHTMQYHHHTMPHCTIPCRFDSIRGKTRQDKTNNGARKEKGRGTDMKGIGGGRDEAGRQADTGSTTNGRLVQRAIEMVREVKIKKKGMIHVDACMHASIHPYIHTSMHSSIHPYIHTSIHPCIH